MRKGACDTTHTKTNLIVERLDEIITGGFYQLANLLTIVGLLAARDLLQVFLKGLQFLIALCMPLNMRSRVVFRLDERKPYLSHTLSLVSMNRTYEGETIPCKRNLVSWLDANAIVVDGIEASDESVLVETEFNAVCSSEVRIEVTVDGAVDWDERVAVFLV